MALVILSVYLLLKIWHAIGQRFHGCCTVQRVSGKHGLADSAENTEFWILRLNHITCGMFIVPRDVSNKMDGSEESHGTSDTEYSSPQLRSMYQRNPT